jgi:hypothetical protein
MKHKAEHNGVAMGGSRKKRHLAKSVVRQREPCLVSSSDPAAKINYIRFIELNRVK